MAITEGTFTAYATGAAGGTSIVSSDFASSGAGLLIAAAIYEGADTTCVFSDDQGNTWETAVRNLAAAQFSVRSAMSWCVPATTVGSGHNVTCTFGASRTNRAICVLNVGGNFSSSDAIAATSQNADGNGSICDAGSLVTSAAAILVQCAGDNAALSWTQGSGWSKKGTAAGRHFQLRIEAAGGTFDPVSGNSLAYDWTTVAMAFKETAGGGGATINIAPLIQNYRNMRVM